MVRMLEQAEALGMRIEVRDQTEFWDSRDPAELVRSVREMNRVVARFSGALYDQLSPAGCVHGPVLALQPEELRLLRPALTLHHLPVQQLLQLHPRLPLRLEDLLPRPAHLLHRRQPRHVLGDDLLDVRRRARRLLLHPDASRGSQPTAP